jgi:lactate dehydrogenase-like 2-hydroxyacid dehydrogenase
MDIGFIGLGIMGAPMAGHLIAGGHNLHLKSRRSVPEALLSAGGKACASTAEVADRSDMIALMLPHTPWPSSRRPSQSRPRRQVRLVQQAFAQEMAATPRWAQQGRRA